MQNLHLFDKNRYFEDMRAGINPKLRDLYKKRYQLNSYRISHNEPIYTGKPNAFSKVFESFTKNVRKNNAPLLLGPHFERDLPTGINDNINSDSIDKNLVKALAGYYVSASCKNNEEFENLLVQYFKEHYNELIHNNENGFLTNFAKVYKNEDAESLKVSDFFKIANQFGVNTENFENDLGSNLVIKDELIYEETNQGLNIIYATDKSINNVLNDLYGETLYHTHLAKENILKANLASNLQNRFVKYAKQNGISLENTPIANTQKRFIKRKRKIENNVIDFRQESC